MEAPAPQIDVQKRVEQFIWCRDEIKRRETAFKESLTELKDTKDKLEGVILKHLNDTKSESIRTTSGTCYTSDKATASLADVEAFMSFVIQNKRFDLMDKKANVTAVGDYLEEHKLLPPGVNYSTEQTLRVNRPRGGK